MTTVYDVIQDLKATSGRKEKEAILKANQDHPLLLRVFKAAYDQNLNYWQSTLPDLPGLSERQDHSDRPDPQGFPRPTKPLDSEATWDLLDRLKSRQITGDAAIRALVEHAGSLCPEDREILKGIIEKDLRCGVTATTLAKVWPEVPEFKDFACLLCLEFEKYANKVKFPAVVQLKYDASRVLVFVDPDGTVTYKTRNGKTYLIDNPGLDAEFRSILQELIDSADIYKTGIFEHGAVLDGEIYQGVLEVSKDSTERGNQEAGNDLDTPRTVELSETPKSRQESNGVATKLVRGTASPEEQAAIGITVWDILPLKKWKSEDFRNWPYRERLDLLGSIFGFDSFWVSKDSNSPRTVENLENPKNSNPSRTVELEGIGKLVKVAKTWDVWSVDEVREIAKQVIQSGEEGIIFKDLGALYEKKRSKGALKVKEVLEVDLEVIGIEPGAGKYSGMVGSLICRDRSGAVQVAVGTGLTDEDRRTLDSTVIGKIISVKYNACIDNADKTGKTLFLPRFVEVRFDKTEADSLAQSEI